MNQTPLPIGAKLNNDKFQVRKILGRGGFGIVYGAVGVDGKNYALKEAYGKGVVSRAINGMDVCPIPDKLNALNRNSSIHLHQCKRAKEEAELFSSSHLKHTNLIPILGHFEQYGTAYLIMPWIKESSLEAAIQFPVAREAWWQKAVLRQIASALTVLHNNNLIHRDLKPDNILLSVVGDKPVPIIIDMGTARSYAGRSNLHTGIATDFGAPEIMSKFEEEKYGKPGPATDCFALAGIAFWMISGHKPASYAARIGAEHIKHGIDTLAKPAVMVPAVWSVLQKSLMLNVSGRHQSVNQFAAELTSAMDAVNSFVVKEKKKDDPPHRSEEDTHLVSGEKLDMPGLIVSVLSIIAIFGIIVIISENEFGLIIGLFFLLVNTVVAAMGVRNSLPIPVALMPGINVWNLLRRQ